MQNPATARLSFLSCCGKRRLVLLLLLAGLSFPRVAAAQTAPAGNGLGGLIIADRKRTRILREAQEMIADQDYVDALSLLQKLLEQDEDQLLRPKSGTKDNVFRSLKTEIHRTIGKLPPDGRAIYVRNANPRAEGLLKEAIQENDEQKLARVARLYFHTPAGYDASYRIGLKRFDHGEPMAAALIWRRLKRTPAAAERLEPMLSIRIALGWIQAGMREEAAQALKSLRNSQRDQELVLSGRTRPLFDADGQPADWLSRLIEDQGSTRLAGPSDWPYPGVTPSRNAVLPAPNPQDVEPWQVSTVVFHPAGVHPEDQLVLETGRLLQSVVSQERNKREQGNQHVLPSRRPVVVRGLVLGRMLVKPRVFELETGEFLWESFSWDSALERLTGLDGSNANVPNARSLIGQWINQRMWEDRTNALMSSDGERLYLVEDTGFWSPLPPQEGVKPIPVSSATVLTAFDLNKGKIVWDVGGQPDESEDTPPRRLEGCYFLGPPLPIAGRLYCLAEDKNEIQLKVLEAETGELEWSQPLAAVSRLPITRDRARRTSGVSVAYGDGVLVCPTDTGATIALDLTTRSLLWGFPNDIDPSHQVNPQGRRRGKPQPQTNQPGGWVDSTPTIAEGKVVLTPLKSSRIYLLDLRTGERLWDNHRGEGLYVAGVTEGKVIVVGKKSVRAWNVADGNASWGETNLSEEPTGRGVIVESRLLLPAGKELLVVDLNTGREVRSIPAPPDVDELGNLVIAQGRLISQTGKHLNVIPFPDLDP